MHTISMYMLMNQFIWFSIKCPRSAGFLTYKGVVRNMKRESVQGQSEEKEEFPEDFLDRGPNSIVNKYEYYNE